MLSIDLSKETEKRLEDFVKKVEISKENFVQQAIEGCLEDAEDYFDAVQCMKDIRSGKEKTIPWEEVKKHLFDDIHDSI